MIFPTPNFTRAPMAMNSKEGLDYGNDHFQGQQNIFLDWVGNIFFLILFLKKPYFYC